MFHDTAEKGGVKPLFPFSYLTPPLSFYWIDTNQGRFVLRLAPPDDAGFLFYEQRMMRQEPALHALIRAHTTIPVAEIVAFDFSQARIDRDYLLLADVQTTDVTERLRARALQWGDVGGRRLRRDLVAQLRRQQVTITRPVAGPAVPTSGAEPRLWTRAERAHRRLSWASRLARNARAADTPGYSVTLYGIAPPLAAYLGVPSVPAPETLVAQLVGNTATNVIDIYHSSSSTAAGSVTHPYIELFRRSISCRRHGSLAGEPIEPELPADDRESPSSARIWSFPSRAAPLAACRIA